MDEGYAMEEHETHIIMSGDQYSLGVAYYKEILGLPL